MLLTTSHLSSYWRLPDPDQGSPLQAFSNSTLPEYFLDDEFKYITDDEWATLYKWSRDDVKFGRLVRALNSSRGKGRYLGGFMREIKNSR